MRSGCRPCLRGSRSTPRCRSSRTPTGSPTPPSSRWATPCSSPGSRCRTSSRRRSASPSRSLSSEGSPPDAPTRSATSGWTSSAAPSACCCRCRSSQPSRCSTAGVIQNFNGFTEVQTLSGGTQVLPGGPGRLAGGDQGTRHQRRRLLQRQLRAPVREPDTVDEPARDPAAARDPVRDAPRLRQDRRRQPPGLRDPRRDGRDLRRQRHRSVLPRGLRSRDRAAAGGRCDGGQGAAVRHPRLHALRRRHDPHVHGCGQLDARFVHRARRHAADDQHDARRGRTGRRRLGTVRDAGARGDRRVRRRPARRTHAGVPRQEDRAARDQAREPLHPRHAGARARRDRSELRAAGHSSGCRVRLDLEPRRARPQRGPLRVHVRGEQQRLRVRRADGEHAVAQHRAGRGDAARPVRADRARARAGRLARRSRTSFPRRPARCRPTRPQFAGLLGGVAVIVTALTYFPVLTLGPLAEGLV